MNREEYLNKRQLLINQAEKSIQDGKLDDYKTICFSYLLDKYGKEQLNEIIKEYNLEV